MVFKCKTCKSRKKRCSFISYIRFFMSRYLVLGFMNFANGSTDNIITCIKIIITKPLNFPYELPLPEMCKKSL